MSDDDKNRDEMQSSPKDTPSAEKSEKDRKEQRQLEEHSFHDWASI